MFSAGFEGDYELNSSRRVDLRGRSRQQTREDVLKRARLARERRALEKRQVSAALIIQKIIRSIRVLRRMRAEMETEISASHFSNVDIHALDRCLDVHRLLFCLNSSNITRFAPQIISLVKGFFIPDPPSRVMSSSPLSQVHCEATLVRILDACLSILTEIETEEIKEIPLNFINAVLESSHYRQVLVKHSNMDWMMKRKFRSPRRLWKLLHYSALLSLRDKEHSFSLEFVTKLVKKTTSSAVSAFVSELLQYTPPSEEGTAFISQLLLSDRKIVTFLTHSSSSTTSKVLGCLVSYCEQLPADQGSEDERLNLLFILMTLTHLTAQGCGRESMQLIGKALFMIQNLLAENRISIAENIERHSLRIRKTTPLSSPSASSSAAATDFSLIYSDLFLQNMARIAFEAAGDHSGTLPSFDESSMDFLTSFCAVCEKIIALGVFPCSRILSALSYNTELNFIRRLWAAYQWSKQNKTACAADGSETNGAILSLFCFLLSNVLSTALDEEIQDSSKCHGGVDSDFLKHITPVLKQALMEEISQYQARYSRSKSKMQSLANTEILKLSIAVRKMHSLNSRIQFIDSEVFSAEGLQIERLKAQAQKICDNPREPEEPDPEDDAFGMEVIPPGLQGFDAKSTIILQFAPYLIPFKTRVEIFQLLIHRDQRLALSRHRNAFGVSIPTMKIQVRRDHLFEDAYQQLSGGYSAHVPTKGSRHERRPVAAETYMEHPFSHRRRERTQSSYHALRGQLRVQFIDAFGAVEPGVDGGGLLRDFLERVIKGAFSENFGLFQRAAENTVYPCPSADAVYEDGLDLRYLYFVGQLVGKAMYEGMLLDLPFATFFLKKFLGLDADLNDLPSLDPELYRNLIRLKTMSQTRPTNTSNVDPLHALEIFFVLDDQVSGQVKQVELLPNGKDIKVTRENAIRYIYLAVHYKLNKRIERSAHAFLSGFFEVIRCEYMRMFHAHELQILISGVQVDKLDVEDLKNNCHVPAGNGEEQILWLWEVLSEMSGEDQKRFLKFVTSSGRPPLLGFSALEPKFSIQITYRDDSSQTNLIHLDEYLTEEQQNERLPFFRRSQRRNSNPVEHDARLPTASTCANLLKLPPYKSKERLRDKLLYAIRSDSGFEFS